MTVAVVGLGAMGSRIARRLLDAGHEVVVWNRDAAKAVSLTERGATAASSPADAVARAAVVVTMVRDADALREVTAGPEGVVAGASGSTAVIQMSTVGPAGRGAAEPRRAPGCARARERDGGRSRHADDLRRR